MSHLYVNFLFHCKNKNVKSGKYTSFIAKNNICGILVKLFLLGSGYFAVDGNLPSETILP